VLLRRGKKSVGLREMKEAIADTASLRLHSSTSRGLGWRSSPRSWRASKS
jgi:hypothetical protein